MRVAYSVLRDEHKEESRSTHYLPNVFPVKYHQQSATENGGSAGLGDRWPDEGEGYIEIEIGPIAVSVWVAARAVEGEGIEGQVDSGNREAAQIDSVAAARHPGIKGRFQKSSALVGGSVADGEQLRNGFQNAIGRMGHKRDEMRIGKGVYRKSAADIARVESKLRKDRAGIRRIVGEGETQAAIDDADCAAGAGVLRGGNCGVLGLGLEARKERGQSKSN
jgi:hypothetical protein